MCPGNGLLTLARYVPVMHRNVLPFRKFTRRAHRRRAQSDTGPLLGVGLVVAAVAGWSTGGSEEQTFTLTAMQAIGALGGEQRERASQVGDYWARCRDAYAAGTVPIYRGEPGYRDRLDGDNDGIACEPYP